MNAHRRDARTAFSGMGRMSFEMVTRGTVCFERVEEERERARAGEPQTDSLSLSLENQ